MKKCQAFRLISGSRTCWVPCRRKALRGSWLCRQHEDAVAGVSLGILVHPECLDYVLADRHEAPLFEKPETREPSPRKGTRTTDCEDAAAEEREHRLRKYLM